MKERLMSVLRAPHISEKSTRLQENNQYVFEISQDAGKADVKAAVEELFSVKVAAVNVVNTKGKARSFRFRTGTRGNRRKAYVRLVEGHTIDVSAKA